MSAIFSPVVYLSCPICYGSREAFGEECRTCADPDLVKARKVLQQLRDDQMRFLRAFGHTLANQPVTGEEWDEYALCQFWIEDDDGVDDPNDYGWLIPPTKIWFASSQASIHYGSLVTSIRYNPLGLLLRECLMAGADAMLPAPASVDTRRMAETGEATGSVRSTSGAVAEGQTPDPTPSITNARRPM